MSDGLAVVLVSGAKGRKAFSWRPEGEQEESRGNTMLDTTESKL